MYAIEIYANPFLHVGPFSTTWYGIIVTIGILAGYWIARRHAPFVGVTGEMIDQVAFWSIAGGLVGARLVHVIDRWELYGAQPELIPQMWRGGGAIWGSIIFGPVAGVVAARIMRLRIRPLLDAGGMGLILGQAIGRVANIVNGEHNSVPTDLPWAFYYTHPNTQAPRNAVTGQTFPAQPVNAYEMLMDLAILGVLMILIRRWGGTGKVFWCYVLMYAVGRFFLTFLRSENLLYGPFTQAQWISLVAAVAAAGALSIGLIRGRPGSAAAR